MLIALRTYYFFKKIDKNTSNTRHFKQQRFVDFLTTFKFFIVDDCLYFHFQNRQATSQVVWLAKQKVCNKLHIFKFVHETHSWHYSHYA